MKILMIASVVIVFLLLAVVLWGRSLPATHEVTVKKQINAPADQIWKVVTDWQGQTHWRKEVQSVEIISPEKFIETPVHGQPVTFEALKQNPPQFLQLQMSGPFQGI